jgi:hypothetical protein
MKVSHVLGAAILILTMAAGSVSALPINSNRPFDNGNLGSLQGILNDNFSHRINAVTGQSSVAMWEESDGTPSAYAVAAVRGDNGVFGVYNNAGTEVTLLTNPTTNSLTSFFIFADGTLLANGSTYTGFGETFGFFWKDTNNGNTAYTEDSKNGGTVRALSYLVKDGTVVSGNLAHYFTSNGLTARNNDDWALAFEDLPNGDFDFNDAVLYVKDISAVPEPGTIFLLGAGLLGLGFYGRKRMKA